MYLWSSHEYRESQGLNAYMPFRGIAPMVSCAKESVPVISHTWNMKPAVQGLVLSLPGRKIMHGGSINIISKYSA